MNGFLNALWIVPILGVLIFLHELGHFVMARRAGVRVEEFGFGLPPRLWGVKRGDTIYSINLLPVGGFVRVLGEDGKSFAPDSMQSKTAGQRTSFLAAGSVMNFLTAFLLIGVLVAIDRQPPDGLTENVYIREVVPNTPAMEAGWRVGDRIAFVAGKPVDDRGDFGSEIDQRLDQPVSVTIERDGQPIETTVVPRSTPPEGQGRTGVVITPSFVAPVVVDQAPAGSVAAIAGLREGDVIQSVDRAPVPDAAAYALALEEHAGSTVDLTVLRDGAPTVVSVTIPEQLPDRGDPLGGRLTQDIDYERTPIVEIPERTVRQFATTIREMGRGLYSLITGATPLDQIAGPIGMGQLTSEVIGESDQPLWVTIVGISALLSLNLGVLNLLPLPALDGGRLLFVLIEVLRRGKRVAPEKEGLVHFVGIVILLSMMLAIAFLDIDRLISGNSFID